MYVGKITENVLEKIAGYPLEYRPTNSEFVDMIAFYLVSWRRRLKMGKLLVSYMLFG